MTMTASRHPWPRRDSASWCPGCAASARPGSWMRQRRAAASRPPSGADVRDFMDALAISQAVLAGYDWGGRAACVVAALWPERVAALVAITGYGIQDIAASARPAAAEQEHRYWYQWYFHTERGRAGLTANRADIARLLWRLWSPNWTFNDATFQATAPASTIRTSSTSRSSPTGTAIRNAPGDPAYDDLEALLVRQPPISVPTIVLHGEDDGVGSAANAIPRDRLFTGPMKRRTTPRAGHFLARENPEDVVAAVVQLAHTELIARLSRPRPDASPRRGMPRKPIHGHHPKRPDPWRPDRTHRLGQPPVRGRFSHHPAGFGPARRPVLPQPDVRHARLSPPSPSALATWKSTSPTCSMNPTSPRS